MDKLEAPDEKHVTFSVWCLRHTNMMFRFSWVLILNATALIKEV